MTNRQTLTYGGLLLFFSFLAYGAVSPLPYTLMQNDLAPLKADFNQAVDQVRLVFIVGPT